MCRTFAPGLDGQLDLKANGTAKLVKGAVDLTSLNGQISIWRNAVVDGHPYGDLELTASTRLPLLTLAAKVNLGGIQMQGNGEWRMEGDYPGQARMEIPARPVRSSARSGAGPASAKGIAVRRLPPGRGYHHRAAQPTPRHEGGHNAFHGPVHARPNASPWRAPSPGSSSCETPSRCGCKPPQNPSISAAPISSLRTPRWMPSGHLALDSTKPLGLEPPGTHQSYHLADLQSRSARLRRPVVNVAVRGTFDGAASGRTPGTDERFVVPARFSQWRGSSQRADSLRSQSRHGSASKRGHRRRHRDVPERQLRRLPRPGAALSRASHREQCALSLSGRPEHHRQRQPEPDRHLGE